MYVDGFDGSDSGDFGAIEAALREAHTSGGTTTRISATPRAPVASRRAAPATVRVAAGPRGEVAYRTGSTMRVTGAPRSGVIYSPRSGASMRVGTGPGYGPGITVGTMLPGGVPGIVPLAPLVPSIGPLTDIPLDVPTDIPMDVPLGPPSFPGAEEPAADGGEPLPGADGGEATNGGLPADGGLPVDGGDGALLTNGAAKESAQPATEWYKKPWPWIVLAAVLGGAVVYLASRKRKPAGLGGLHEKIYGAKLIVPDLKAGLFYAWKGGNAVCVFDKDGVEQICFSADEPTIQAARDLARKKIRAYWEPGRERWDERDPRLA